MTTTRASQCRMSVGTARQVLQDQLSMPTESERQRTTDQDQQLEHDSILAGAGARINSDGFWRGSAPESTRASSGEGHRIRRACCEVLANHRLRPRGMGVIGFGEPQGSRRPSPEPDVGRWPRPEGGRSDATGGPSTTRSRGDATRRPWRVGRPLRRISGPAMPIAIRSRTTDRTNEWRASAECVDRPPTAAAAPGSREPMCGVRLRERSATKQRG